MLQKDVLVLIIASSATFFMFGLSFIIFYNLFQRKKLEYNQEIIKTKFEIKEQTFKNIAWEIHDNIGQILSTMHFLQYSILEEAPEDLKPKIKDSQQLLERSIVEIRALSKSLNTDYIKTIGLLEIVKSEIERIDRMKSLRAELIVKGNAFRVDEEVEVVLLRILQEFISNTLKHSKAKNLTIQFEFVKNQIKIQLKDDGVGFENPKLNGTGLLNMKNRAKMIGAKFQVNSTPNQGTQLELVYNSKHF